MKMSKAQKKLIASKLLEIGFTWDEVRSYEMIPAKDGRNDIIAGYANDGRGGFNFTYEFPATV